MKRWYKYIKPYLPFFIIGPICMIVEVIGEILMPKFLSLIIDYGYVLFERRCQSIGITSFEENKVFGNIAGLILFQSEVNTIFPRNSLKVLDILVGDLNVCYPLVLPHELLHALLPAGLNRTLTFLFLSIRKVL